MSREIRLNEPEFPDVVEPKMPLRDGDCTRQVNGTDPNFTVHIPIIPHNGTKIVATFVTTNFSIDSQTNERMKIALHTIFFVLIFQYFWMYQKVRVLIVEVTA